MMSPNFIQEQLSWAYVNAVVHRAGFSLSRPVVDNRGIDGTIESCDRGLNRVDFQLKSSTNYAVRDGEIIYDLRAENYDHLIKDTGCPKF